MLSLRPSEKLLCINAEFKRRTLCEKRTAAGVPAKPVPLLLGCALRETCIQHVSSKQSTLARGQNVAYKAFSSVASVVALRKHTFSEIFRSSHIIRLTKQAI